MAESVDALVSNTSGAIRAGSTPALGTKKFLQVALFEAIAGFFIYITGKLLAKSLWLTCKSLGNKNKILSLHVKNESCRTTPNF